jgi:flagellar biosynthesis protein FlhF
MDLKVFKAPTMAEALNAAKTEYGPAAVILHTRSVETKRYLGLVRNTHIELTVGRNLPKARKKPQKHIPPPAAPVRPEAPTKMPSPLHAEIPPTARPGDVLLGTPAAQAAQYRQLNQEMADLKSVVKDLVRVQHQQVRPDLPDNLQDAYMQLISNAVAEELAQQIIRRLIETTRPMMLADERQVRHLVAKELAKLLPTAGPIRRAAQNRPHVLALIGPTGVGKTTTVAKLAANLKLREGHRVGLITIDTYRLAAVDQLRKYADIIGADLEVVANPEQIKPALEKLAGCDFVLVDTAGRSPKATEDLAKLREFLAAAAPDEVHLVLSSTASPRQLELVTEKFNQVRLDKVIFTKLDEAAQVGVVLNVAAKLGKQLSYITTGQDVPNDIEVSDAKRIAQLILGDDLPAAERFIAESATEAEAVADELVADAKQNDRGVAA